MKTRSAKVTQVLRFGKSELCTVVQKYSKNGCRIANSIPTGKKIVAGIFKKIVRYVQNAQFFCDVRSIPQLYTV